MIKYDGSHYKELKFASIRADADLRDGQWIDVYFDFVASVPQDLPVELRQPSGWLICSSEGEVVQFVVLDEGCDSEYLFTEDEKNQVLEYIRQNHVLKSFI